MKFHGSRFGERLLGDKVAADVSFIGDPMAWPIIWTSPLSLAPPRAVERAKAECDLSEVYFGATRILTGTLDGWLIETDGSDLFWSGKNREGFRLRRAP